jgi:hypothetical protein
MRNLRVGCRNSKTINLVRELGDRFIAGSVVQYCRGAVPIGHDNDNTPFGEPKPRSGMRIAARGGRDRSGWIGASHDKERPLYTRKTPPMAEDIFREVFNLALAIRKSLSRHQDSWPAGRQKQFPCAISNLQ